MSPLHESLEDDTTCYVNSSHLMLIGKSESDNKALSQMLRNLDFAVDLLNLNNEGIEKVIERRPELIIFNTSSVLWDEASTETIQTLQALETTHKTPILLLATSKQASCRIKALQMGVSDCMVKPVDPHELQLRIDKQLTIKQKNIKLEHEIQLYEQHYGPLKTIKSLDENVGIRKEINQVNKARRILSANLATPPSLNDLASMLGTNQPRLSRNFRTVFGITVFGYLREQRLQCAKRLLTETSMSIKAIALEVGYRNTSDLTRGIKERFGMPPTELREQLRISNIQNSTAQSLPEVPIQTL